MSEKREGRRDKKEGEGIGGKEEEGTLLISFAPPPRTLATPLEMHVQVYQVHDVDELKQRLID